MRLVPEDNYGKISFFKSHLAPWTEHAEQIGTTPEEVALLQAEFEAAQEALAAHNRARQAALSATANLKTAIEQMCRRGAAIVGQIRSAGRIQGDALYNLAQIPVPQSASTLAPPGNPSNCTTDVNQIGWLTLRWKCKNPRGSSGTMYQITRRLDDTGPFEHLATVGKKSFVDKSIPLGTKTATYSVQAIRSTRTGRTTEHTVYFGSAVPEKAARDNFQTRDAA